MKVINLILFIVFIWSACGDKVVRFDSAEEYHQFINDPKNGFIESIEIGNNTLSLQYVPVNSNSSDSLLQFWLTIKSSTKGQDPLVDKEFSNADYQQKINYLILNVNRDCYLISDNDTIQCSMHHFERNYSLTEYHKVFFVFDNEKQLTKSSTLKFVFDDKVLGFGKSVFTYNISELPQIVLNKSVEL